MLLFFASACPLPFPVKYNPGQNYLRKFFPSCPLSYATKLFSKQCLCGKKTPSPNSMLLPTNAQGSGFLLNTQQHCFQGKGEREEPVKLWCLEKCCPSIQFSQQFFSKIVAYSRTEAHIYRGSERNYEVVVLNDENITWLLIQEFWTLKYCHCYIYKVDFCFLKWDLRFY